MCASRQISSIILVVHFCIQYHDIVIFILSGNIKDVLPAKLCIALSAIVPVNQEQWCR